MGDKNIRSWVKVGGEFFLYLVEDDQELLFSMSMDRGFKDHLFKLFKIENQKRTPNLQNKIIHI